jgi:hypothetical protein
MHIRQGEIDANLMKEESILKKGEIKGKVISENVNKNAEKIAMLSAKLDNATEEEIVEIEKLIKALIEEERMNK